MKKIKIFLTTCSLPALVVLASVSNAAESLIDPKLKAAFAVAAHERVAVIGIGDSNQRFGGHGHSAAMARALGEALGCYGTELTAYHPWAEKGQPIPAPAPVELASQAFRYWYIPAGQQGGASWRNGQIIVSPDHPLGIQGHLRFHLTYGTFAGDAGSFLPEVRRDQEPWTVLEWAERPLKPAKVGWGFAHYSLDLPADEARDYPVQFMPNSLRTPIEGPFLATFGSVENIDKRSGIAYHTLYASGGKSLGEMLTALRSYEPPQLDSYFTEVRRMLNGRRTCIVMICSGLNDRNRKGPSVGVQGGLVSSSPEGYADNLEGLVQLLTATWMRAGGSPETLHFAFMPSHPLGDPDDVRLVSYRVAAASLAARLPNASSINLAELVPYDEMASQGYYDQSRTSDPHLDRKGYMAIATSFARALKEPGASSSRHE